MNSFQTYMFDYQLYAPYSIMWNLPSMWRYAKKDVDAGRLAAAVNKVLDAHPVFRTILHYNEDSELVQRYEPDLPVEVPLEKTTENKFRLTILPALVQPFRLLDEPIYRCRIFETAENVWSDCCICAVVDKSTPASPESSMPVFSVSPKALKYL